MSESTTLPRRQDGAGSRFKLRTLGAVALLYPDGHPALGPGVPLAFLTYLHASPGRRARREHLAAVFWSNSDTAHARQALRKNLSRLRGVLGEAAFEDLGSEVRVTTAVTSDREEFLEAISRGDPARATGLYGGAFFPEFGSPGAVEFEHWAEAERERLRILFLQAAEGAIRAGLDRAQAREVLDLALRVRGEAPDSESASRLLLEVYLATRDRHGAAIEADRIAGRLREEGRRPEPATARILQLVREGSIPEPPESETGIHAELVGREREFHLLLRAWHSVARGLARYVHVEGKAGIGKTRLLDEVADRIQTLGGRVVRARGKPGERTLDFAFAADLARELAELPGAKGVSARSASLLVGLHPALGSIFPGAAAEPGDPERLQQRALAFGDLVTAVSENGRIALLLDDVHWVDSFSAQLLGAALARLSDASALVLTAGRPGSAAGLGGREGERVLLSPLPLAETESLLASIAAFPTPASGRRFAVAVHQATSGSPLLILETIQLALEHGRLERLAGSWRMPDEDSLITWLPTLRPVEERLGSLSTPARRLLLTLAATGAPLAQGDLEGALGSGIVSTDTVADLERRGYLAVRENRWDLAHDEVGDAIVRLASAGERERAHAALGRALLERGIQEARQARRAARHLVMGRADSDLARLFRAWVLIARRRGEWASAAALARELLGELSSPAAVTILVRELPWVLRYPTIGRVLLRSDNNKQPAGGR